MTDVLDGRMTQQPMLTIYTLICHGRKLINDGSVQLMCKQTLNNTGFGTGTPKWDVAIIMVINYTCV